MSTDASLLPCCSQSTPLSMPRAARHHILDTLKAGQQVCAKSKAKLLQPTWCNQAVSTHTRMSGAGMASIHLGSASSHYQSCCPSSHLGCSRHATSPHLPAKGAPGSRHRVHIPRSLRTTMQVTQTMKYICMLKHNRTPRTTCH